MLSERQILQKRNVENGGFDPSNSTEVLLVQPKYSPWTRSIAVYEMRVRCLAPVSWTMKRHAWAFAGPLPLCTSLRGEV